jgi:hypothetical protein
LTLLHEWWSAFPVGRFIEPGPARIRPIGGRL